MYATHTHGMGRFVPVFPVLLTIMLFSALCASAANAQQSTDFDDIESWFVTQFGNTWYAETIGDLTEGALQTVTLPHRYAGWEFEIQGETGSDPLDGDEFELAPLSHAQNDHAANDGLIARTYPTGADVGRILEFRFRSDNEAFDLDSIEMAYLIGDLGNGPGASDDSAQAIWVRGYNNGSEIHSQEVSGSVTMSGWQLTPGGPDGMIFNTISPAGFTNIDEIRIEVVPSGGSNNASNFTDYIALRDLQVSAATVPADPPIVTTASPTSITTNSATLGGNVTDDGGAFVTERGIVYSTSPDPDTDDNKVQMGSDIGSFSQNVTNLTPGTLYYVKAYAINSEDTAYGQQQSFTTLVNVTSINRHDPSVALTNSSSVVYQVNLNGPVSGLGPSNFNLVQSGGLSGASISSMAGSGSTYEVTVNTGTGDGTLRLDLDNTTGVSPSITQLPYTSGQTYTIDKTPPEVTISSLESDPTNANPIPVDIEFSEDVTGFVVGDITVGGGTLSNFAGSGASYSVDVTPTGDGTITVDVPAGVAQDAAGNDNTAATQFSIVYDGTAPSVMILSTESSPTNASPIPVSIDFSEDVTGFVLGDIVVSGGSLSNLSGSGANYTVDVTASGDGTITVDVPAGVAQDAAGNDNTAATQFSIVYDETAPTVTLSSVHETTNLSAIPVSVQFSETVTGFTAGDIDVVNGSVDPTSFVDDGSGQFSVDINPDDLDQGLTYDIVISIPAAAAEDPAGNPSEASEVDLVITFDSVAPGVIISADQVNEFDGELYSNAEDIAITITFDRPVWDFAGADIGIDNATWSDFTGDDGDTEFTVTIDPPPGTGPEVITISIDAGVAEDEAGNENTAATPLEINWDQNRPDPVISTTAPAVTGNSPIPIVIDFGKPVQAFTTAMAEAAVSSDGGASFSIQDLTTENDEVFTFDLVPDADDVFTIELAEAAVLDWHGNESMVSNAVEVTFDSDRPVINFHAVEAGGEFTDEPLTSPTNADVFSLYVSFSKPVIDFAENMLDETNALLSEFNEVNAAGGLYSVRVEVVDDGEVSVFIAEGAVQDEAGNDNQEALFTIESDQSAPEVVVMEANIDPAPINPGFTNVSAFELQLQFSKPIADFDIDVLIVENASVSLLDEENQQNFTLGVTANDVTDSAHTVSVEVPQGGFTDEAGNVLGNGESFAIQFGDVQPTAGFTTTATDPTDGEPIPVTLTITEIFGEEVSGFDVSDIDTENVASIEWIGGTNPVFELEITPEGVGDFDITLSLPEGAVSDIAGNPSEASGVFTIRVTHGVDAVPVPVAGPLGLVILALLTLAMGIRSSSGRQRRQSVQS